MIPSALKNIFVPDPVKSQAHVAYVHIVEQARQPIFFEGWGVEDTIDGRFDLIVLHLSLVIARLEKDATPESSEDITYYIRILSEVFFSDMDRSLRELGASDTGVGKRINKMAQAFYGRLKAYSLAVDAGGDAFKDAVIRNVYRENVPDGSIMENWGRYYQHTVKSLADQSVQDLLKGHVRFSN